ncbi:UbiA prenyltransferase family-domain-containing protein [Cladochytrium replicatum]|nr:UbiA prenyltransferase family-domain-containing protein [Cladochytrium replicatum]
MSTQPTPQQDANAAQQPARSLISRIRPFMELARADKPVATLMLYLPCTWSILMATYHSPTDVIPLVEAARMLALFGAGAFVMRGAGCTINDIWDMDIDKKVERTRTRPLASGAITPFQALVFLGGQLSVGLAVLMQLNTYSILLGASSLAVVVIYPLMKRITYWPQAVLGLAFNWGALLGWSAMLGSLYNPVTLPLYLSGVCWTLVYDTIYALQDKPDDVKVGVKSTAIRFGSRTREWLSLFASGSIGFLALAGFMNGQGLPFYLISCMGAAAHYSWQIATVKIAGPNDGAVANALMRDSAWRRFKSNSLLGGIITIGLVADLLRKRTSKDEGDEE